MPGNVIGAAPGDLIARRILDTLLEEFGFLRKISVDFSPEMANFNQQIVTKIPNPMTAGSYNTSTGYDPQDTEQVDVELTIDQHKHVTYAFNDQERSSHSVDLIERYARNGAHAIGLAMMNDLLAKVTTANFPTEYEQPAEAFDRADVQAVRKKLNLRKVPLIGRFMLLNSNLAENLSKESVLVANPGSPSDAVRTGQLGMIEGFETMEYAFLPDNGENLAGIAGLAEGLIMATRLPTMPKQEVLGGLVKTITEPNTGLSIQLRQWYDFRLGKEFRTYTLMFGTAVGNPECLERIVTS